ncbi:MAG: HD domain-containing phosphohydrolase [Polyangiaceae bacterium]
MTERPSVLCVDDDVDMLDFLRRTLRGNFEVTTEERPLAALQLLEADEQRFAAIVSDMNMPLMDGATFLSSAAKLAPKSTRVMLTAQRDLGSAIAAVNTGQVFRFLCKPCIPQEVLGTVQAAVEQHRLITLEQRLLQNTLAGGVRLMSEVLGLVAPGLFARTSMVQRYVLFLAQKLGRTDAWRFELAACLHMIGCVGLPEETLQRALSGAALGGEEARAFAEHPQSAYRLLQKIPHFEDIAEMIRLESAGPSAPGAAAASADIELGAAMLHVARAVARRTAAGKSEAAAAQELLASASPQQQLAAPGRVWLGRSPRGRTRAGGRGAHQPNGARRRREDQGRRHGPGARQAAERSARRTATAFLPRRRADRADSRPRARLTNFRAYQE